MDKLAEYYFGFTYYFAGNDLKLQAGYVYGESKDTAEPRSVIGCPDNRGDGPTPSRALPRRGLASSAVVLPAGRPSRLSVSTSHPLIAKFRCALLAGAVVAAAIPLARCDPAVMSALPRAPAAPNTTITATASFVNQYMFRGERLGGPSFQPVLDVSRGDLALGVWCNFPLKDKLPGQSDPEFNFYGSYTFALSERVDLSPGFTFYDYPRAPTDAGFFRSTFEPHLALMFTLAGVKFGPRLFHDFGTHDSAGEVGASYALPLPDAGTAIDFTGTLGTHVAGNSEHAAAPRLKAWGNYWLLGFAVPYHLPGAGKLTFGWAYTRGTGAFTKRGTAPKDVNPFAVGRGVGTVSYTREY